MRYVLRIFHLGKLGANRTSVQVPEKLKLFEHHTLTGQMAQQHPPRPTCSCLSSLLWPTNHVHDLSLARVGQNTQFAVTNLKRKKTMRTTIWHRFLIWLTADLTDKSLEDRSLVAP